LSNSPWRRHAEFYWKAYGDIISYLSGKDEKLFGFITYCAEDEQNDGKVEYVPFTKYQKNLLQATKPLAASSFFPRLNGVVLV